jgi:hypothetical protein
MNAIRDFVGFHLYLQLMHDLMHDCLRHDCLCVQANYREDGAANLE